MSDDTHKHTPDPLTDKLQQQLRNSELELDAPTQAKLHAARNRAVAASNSREINWSGWTSAAVAACVTAVAIYIALDVGVTPELSVQPTPETAQTTPELSNDPFQDASLEDFEISLLMAAEGDELLEPLSEETSTRSDSDELLDLYENLEFYEWLAYEDLEESAS